MWGWWGELLVGDAEPRRRGEQLRCWDPQFGMHEIADPPCLRGSVSPTSSYPKVMVHDILKVVEFSAGLRLELQ